MTTHTPQLSACEDYTELRFHEQHKSLMVMIDGNLTTNSHNSEAGTSARVYDNGYWGFSALTGVSSAHTTTALDKARSNAKVMSVFGSKATSTLPSDAYRGEHRFIGKKPLTQTECIELLDCLTALCKQRYPVLTSVAFRTLCDHHIKQLTTSVGSQVTNTIQRAALSCTFTMRDESGRPVRLTDFISAKGSVADLDVSMPKMEKQFDELYQHLRAKREAVPARGGLHTVVLAANLAGMLAHEAMGHPCEADAVLGGAATKDLVGKRVASDLVSMVDFAHSYRGEELMMPVYADDEGTPSTDVVMIKDGILRQFMNSRETAALTGQQASGNARAFGYNDEPLVRMRNTAILPGKDKLEDMIAGVEDGYYLMRTSNGQADSTTEFMFGINLGYEIRNGKLGRAIKDTTLSGNAIKMLQNVDAISNDMYWTTSGYCGKKQSMVVSMGGPALRSIAHLGGE